MPSDMTQAKHLVELGNLQSYIQASLGLECQILEQSAEIPVNTLAVVLEPDEQGRDRIASISFLPLEDDDLDAIKLLQFYIQVPYSGQPEYQTKLEKFLLAASLRIPIGTFSLDESSQLILKYVYPQSKFGKINQNEFVETFLLFSFVLDQISPLIEEVAAGRIDLDEACSQLP